MAATSRSLRPKNLELEAASDLGFAPITCGSIGRKKDSSFVDSMSPNARLAFSLAFSHRKDFCLLVHGAVLQQRAQLQLLEGEAKGMHDLIQEFRTCGT